MAHPVRKHTKSRQGKRRAHWNLELPAVNTGNASALETPWTLRHFAAADGYYRGRKVVDVKKKSKSED